MIGSSKSLSGFDPRTIPGCQLWLDAADSLTVTGTTSVTAWADKSGNGFNGTVANASVGSPVAPSYVTNSINGLPAITMSGTSYFTGSTNVNSTTLTAFFIGNCVFGTGGSSQQRILGLSVPGLDDYSSTLRPIPLTVISGGTQLLSYRNANMASATVVSGINFIGCCLFDGTSNYMYKDGTLGTQVASSGTFTTSIYGVGSDAGIQNNGGAAALGTNCLVGKIGEMLVYNTALTTSQRQQVEGYLAHKWGLVPYYDSSTPLSIPGCQLWLDGADPSGTGTAPASGATVSTWNDKSGNGKHATATGTITYLSGGGVNFNGSSYFLNQTFSQNLSQRSIFVVFNETSHTDYAGVFPLIPNPNSGFDQLTQTGLSVEVAPNGYGYTLAFFGNATGYRSRLGSGAFFQKAIYYDSMNGTTGSGYFNGVNVTNEIATYTAGSCSGYGVGGRWQGGIMDASYRLNGVVHEILFYNRTLTNSERQTIERYLMKKWAIGTNPTIPSTHPFSSIRPHLRAFQPTDIDGCLLWLDAADSSTITGTTSVTAWTDKSGRGNNAVFTGTNPSYTPANKYVETSNLNQEFSVPSTIFNTVGGSLFIVYADKKQNTQNGMLYAISSGYTPHLFDQSLFRSDGYSYALGGVDSPGDTFKNALNTTNTVLYSINYVYGSANYTVTVNGTTFPFTSTYGTAIVVPSGSLVFSGGWGGGANVKFNEILFYNQILTASERQQVEGYLAHKWGLIGPSSITPLTIPGCQLWLDVTDSSTTVSSGSVTSITNKCTNTAATLSSTLPTYNSSLINGLPGINFTGSSFIRGNFSSAYTGSNLIVFAVGSLSSTITTAYARLVSFSVPGSLDYNSVERVGAILRQLQIQGISSYRNGGEIGSGTGIAYNTNYLFCTEFTGTTYNFYLNGSKTSTASSSGSFNISAWGVGYLADYGGSDDAAYWKGSFGECITYLGSLTTAQRQTIENYLLNKWGISNTSSSLISTHPFKSIPPATSAHFSPTSISGCQLWLDGSDSSTVTFSSGSNVNQWSDKSGNGRNATVYNGTPTYTVSSGMTFNGSSSLQVSYPASPTVESLFVIVKFNSVSAQGDLFSGTSTGQREFLMYSPYSPGTMYLGRYGFAPSGSINGGTVTTGTTYMLNYVFNGTGNTISFFQSGNTIISGTPQFTYSSGGTISLIGSYGGGGFLQGQVYEMIVYNTAVTTSQRQQVEGYLAHKWGLTSSVPSKHPYRPLPPIFPPNLFIPTPSMYSAFFNNGGNTFLSIPANSALTLGTNNHTIEFWMYQITRGQYDVPFAYGKMNPQTATTNYYINCGSGGFGLVIGNGAGGWAVQISGAARSLNTWHHYAIVRNGNTFTLYDNGTSVNSVTASINIPAQGDVFRIGSDGEGYGVLNGYITNFRVVNGTAVYTSNFTPPTSPLTAIPNTQMLIQGLVDNSPNAFTVTNNAGVTLSTTVTPF